MKKVILIVAAFAGLIIGCTSKSRNMDVPTFQVNGWWRINSYMEEKYLPSVNTVTRQHFSCGPKDYMIFSDNQIVVHYDSAGTTVWPSSVLDQNTLLIQGKKWDVVKLGVNNFYLSLFQRDSSKLYEIVRYELVRPW